MNSHPQELDAGGRRRNRIAIALLVVVLLGLPIAVWLDVQSLTHAILARQADELNSMITSIRQYYSNNVVDRVLAQHGGEIKVLHNYDAVPGAIPIPATLSLELGAVIGEKQSNVAYRFISDFPFRGRAAHVFDSFEKSSLEALRANPEVFPLIKSTARSAERSKINLMAAKVCG